MLLFPCLGGCPNEATHNVKKTIRVRHIIDHESRECVSGIHRDVPPFFDRCLNTQALCLQFLDKTIPVRLGSGNDSHITAFQSGCDKTSKAIQKDCIVRIELNLMAVRDFFSWGTGEPIAS